MSAPKDYRQDRESFRLDFVASAAIWIGLACLAAWGQHKSMTAEKPTASAVATPVACSTPAAPVAPAAKTKLRQANLH